MDKIKDIKMERIQTNMADEPNGSDEGREDSDAAAGDMRLQEKLFPDGIDEERGESEDSDAAAAAAALKQHNSNEMSMMMESQETPLSDQEKENKTEAMTQVRKQSEDERFRSMEKHPRCALLPSPDLLDKGCEKGSDKTNTAEDVDSVLNWFKQDNVLNAKFYDEFKWKGQELTIDDYVRKWVKEIDEDRYGTLVQLAFTNAFAAMRDTAAPAEPEMVVWYYTGHGLGIEKLPDASPMPDLKKVPIRENAFDNADEFLPEPNTKVKGGELCLHHIGFCGLRGMLRPWISAVEAESQHAKNQIKKNKHLVIILDSCHSGIIADDLKKLIVEEQGPWNTNGCTVTIQAACAVKEVTYGGYFTPCFKFFNRPENQVFLTELKKKWEDMNKEDKEIYKGIQLPSPKVVSTLGDGSARSLDETERESPTIDVNVQGFSLVLFQNPGFFKFCSISHFEKEEYDLLSERVLDIHSASAFMKNSPTFKLLDYKLKTVMAGSFYGTPMGLFLLEDPSYPTQYTVCAHVHFAHNDTSRVGRINLVHHKVPPLGSVLYTEDHDGLSKNAVKKSKHKIPYAMVPMNDHALPNNPSHWLSWEWKTGIPAGFTWPSGVDQVQKKDEVKNGKRLVEACYNIVQGNEPGRWDDVSKWTMKSGDPSMMGMFKQKQRSVWMEKYLEEYGYSYQKPTSTNDA